ncbi:MAG: transglutaminase domain-containing protein [Candidatus Thorarchaeota archaeon]|nr:transglutaminase domain-containing protein [Candidatus Thorarchaeota archaeon]
MIESILDQHASEDMRSSIPPYDPRIGYRPAEKSEDIMVPKIFDYPESGECIVRTSLPDEILQEHSIELNGEYSEVESYPLFGDLDNSYRNRFDYELDPGDPGGGYAYGVVAVPSVWSIGKLATVSFELHNMYDYSITVTCTFRGKEGTSQEWYVSSSAVVNAFTTRTVSLGTYVPNTSVGLKTGVAEISGGITYYHQYGNEFVQIFGSLPTPPSDPMSTATGNPNYIWEGCSNDGFSWSSSYKIFHPESWSVRYSAASWLDKTTSSASSVYSIGQELNSEVHDRMTYDADYQYAVSAVFSDTYIMATSNYRGVCDEYAVLATSMYRAMGIPVRYLVVYSPTFAHALLEIWAPKDGSWTWILSDPTWEWYDRAEDEELELIYIYAGFDDSRTTYGDVDGTTTNGRIQWYTADMRYHYKYDGPNDYFYVHLPCDTTDSWFDATGVFETYRTLDSTGTLKVGSYWGNEYFYCDDIASSTAWKHGPAFYYTITMGPKLKDIVLFKADLQLVSSLNKMGDLIVTLYDDNYDLIEVFCLYDSWYSSSSKGYIEYQFENGVIDQTLVATKTGSWRVDWKFWFDSGSNTVKSQLGSGTVLTHDSSTINPNRVVKYIGIQFARASTYVYHGSNLRVFDIILDWKV